MYFACIEEKRVMGIKYVFKQPGIYILKCNWKYLFSFQVKAVNEAMDCRRQYNTDIGYKYHATK